MGTKCKGFIEELKNIQTVQLTTIAGFFLEKIFWTSLGIMGIAWAFYFIPSNLEVWCQNPSIITRGNFNLSQIKYPAITVKPSGITKYAIAERLANYIKPDKMPLELREVRNLLLKCATLEDLEDQKRSDKYHHTKFENDCLYNFRITQEEKAICEVIVISRWCFYETK